MSKPCFLFGCFGAREFCISASLREERINESTVKDRKFQGERKTLNVEDDDRELKKETGQGVKEVESRR